MSRLHVFTALLIPLLLSSCAAVYEGSYDKGFVESIIRNRTMGVMENVTPRNASMPINGSPPIYYAAAYGNEDMIDVLWNNGASLKVRNAQGKSLAYAAAANGHTSTARKLVNLGAGSSGDLSSGASAYQNQLAREADARRVRDAALAWFAAALAQGAFSSGGSSGQGGSGLIDYDKVRAVDAQKQWDASQGRGGNSWSQ